MLNDFQRIENLLADGIFAAYLLGFDESLDEHAPLIEQALANFSDNYPNYPHSIEFAGDDDKRAERAGNLDLRFDVPPSEAIDYFQRKKILPSKEFYDLRNEARSAAFTVSGIYRKDVLEAFRQEIENALRDGSTRKSVVKNFKEILAGAGHKELGDFHLETVARTNMMMAYGVGRRRQMEEVVGLLPYWQYNAIGDDRTRPKHRALDGIVLPFDNSFWDAHFPPSEFRCRCSVSAILDEPKNYNRLNPNNDATIAYDENGVPVKVEIGTAVYDLSVQKFVGVPRQNIGLRKTIETAAKETGNKRRSGKDVPEISERERQQLVKDWQRQLEDIKKLDIRASGSQLPVSIIEDARRMRSIDSQIEVMRVYKPSGEFINGFSGTADEIEVPDDVLPKLNGGIDMHWHPPDGKRFFESFSFADIEQATLNNSSRTLVVTRNYLYSMRAPSGWSLPLLEKIYKLFVRYNSNIEKDLLPLLDSGAIDFDELQDVARHLVWKKLARKLGLDYKRIDL